MIEQRNRTEPERFAAGLGARPRAGILIQASTDADDVVETHHHVGDNDDPEGLEQGRAVPDMALPAASIRLAHELDAIQMSASPPTTCSRGMRSRYVMIVMKIRRRATAPAAPQIRPWSCCRFGRVRTASAMTSALSPARARSIRTIFRTPTMKSTVTSPPPRRARLYPPTRSTRSRRRRILQVGAPGLRHRASRVRPSRPLPSAADPAPSRRPASRRSPAPRD